MVSLLFQYSSAILLISFSVFRISRKQTSRPRVVGCLLLSCLPCATLQWSWPPSSPLRTTGRPCCAPWLNKSALRTTLLWPTAFLFWWHTWKSLVRLGWILKIEWFLLLCNKKLLCTCKFLLDKDVREYAQVFSF